MASSIARQNQEQIAGLLVIGAAVFVLPRLLSGREPSPPNGEPPDNGSDFVDVGASITGIEASQPRRSMRRLRANGHARAGQVQKRLGDSVRVETRYRYQGPAERLIFIHTLVDRFGNHSTIGSSTADVPESMDFQQYTHVHHGSMPGVFRANHLYGVNVRVAVQHGATLTSALLPGAYQT